MGRVFLIMIGLLIPASKLGAQAISLTIPQIWAVQGNTQTGSGQMTVTDAGGQPAAGGVVSIQSSNSAVLELPLVQVQLSPQGQGTFTVRKHLDQATGCPSVSLTATYQGTTASEVVPICSENFIGPVSGSQSAGVDAIGIFRTEVVGGNPAVATITYNYGGQLVAADVVSVSLSSSNPSVASLPSSIDVQGGIATVEIATQPVNVTQTVTITASSTSLDSKSATLTVRPSSEASLKSLTFAAAAIKAGEGTIGTLRLSKPAMRAITVNLSSAPQGTLQTPSTITFNAGESEKTFKVLSAERTRPQRVVLEALQVNAPAVKAVLEIK